MKITMQDFFVIKVEIFFKLVFDWSLPLGVKASRSHSLQNVDPSFLQPQSSVLVTILVQNDDIVILSIVDINSEMLGNRVLGVLVVILDV